MKINFLFQNVIDTETVNKGIALMKSSLASIGIPLEYTIGSFNGQLTSYTSKYIDTAKQEISFTLVHPASFPTLADTTFLVYDWTKVSPQPTMPANHGHKIQMPIEWYYDHEVVFLMFALHELCHDLVPDLTHNQSTNGEWSQKPPTDYYLYLLKTYYKKPIVNTSPAIVASIVNTIKKGMKGEAVKALQADLKSLGFYTGKVDGDFGAMTEQAVKTLQSANNLTADGIVGKKTLAAIEGLKKKPNTFGLKPLAARRANAFLSACKAQGEELAITEGYRTIERQNTLYAQGRTAPGAIVTKSKGGQSFHNYGVAFDVIFVVNGKRTYDVPSAKWQKIGKIGESLGLEWGGRFSSPDLPHFEMKLGYSLSDFLAKRIDESKYE